MVSVQERNKRFYTDKGLASLLGRFKTWVDLFNQSKLPLGGEMYGFGKFQILSKDECLARIKELAEILGLIVKLQKETKVMTDGKEEVTEIIIFND